MESRQCSVCSTTAQLTRGCRVLILARWSTGLVNTRTTMSRLTGSLKLNMPRTGGPGINAAPFPQRARKPPTRASTSSETANAKTIAPAIIMARHNSRIDGMARWSGRITIRSAARQVVRLDFQRWQEDIAPTARRVFPGRPLKSRDPGCFPAWCNSKSV